MTAPTVTISHFRGDTLTVDVKIPSENLAGIYITSRAEIGMTTDSDKTFGTYWIEREVKLTETRVYYPGLGDEKIVPTEGIVKEIEREINSWLMDQKYQAIADIREAA